MTNRIWILGASDPEMEAIESLLRECGERVAYALDGSGKRVTPASAYRAARPQVADGEIDIVYAVECGGDWFGSMNTIAASATADDAVLVGCLRIDHHRPGDPGYGRPPSEFLEASSIGQVIAELARLGQLPESWETSGAPEGFGRERGILQHWHDGHRPYSHSTVVSVAYGETGDASYGCDGGSLATIPHDFVLTAAADHCLGAAYRGECPGVDPDALMRWRVESRARFQGREPDSILADIARARDALRCAPEVDLAMCCDGSDEHHPNSEWWCGHCGRRWAYVRDLRDCHVPELPDAASRDGEAYLATVSVDGSGRPCRPKIVLGGATTPEMVRAFLEHWAPAHGLVDCYGDPERGFAGGYLPGEAHP